MYAITIVNHPKIKKLKIHFNFIRQISSEQILHCKTHIFVFGSLFFELYYPTNSCYLADNWTIQK